MHQAIELLLKRMESNPEEFVHTTKNRWKPIIKRYEHLFSEEENAAIKTKLREIEFGEFHKDIMAELLYGEERRLEEAEGLRDAQMDMVRYEYQRRREMQNSLHNHLIGSTTTPLPGSITSINTDGNTGSATYAAQLHIGGETIDNTLIKKLKALLTKEST